MLIEGSAFEAVGLHVGSERAEAFVAGLCREANAIADEGIGHRHRVAVDRALVGLQPCDLADIVEGLGLGAVTVAVDGEGPEARRALGEVLRHLLRRRLIDALRISAGLPAFWPWSPSRIVSLYAPSDCGWGERCCSTHL